MSDPDRGGNRYQGERPLSFDARQPVRGERAVPVAFLISASILIILLVAVVFAYRGGVRRADQAPSAVGASVGDMKTLAPADAQPVDPAAGLQIYNDEKGATPSADAADSANPGFAPPPEQPQPRPAAIPSDTTPPITTSPPPAATSPAAAAQVSHAAQPAAPVAARPLNSPTPPAATPAPRAAPAPAPVAAAPTAAKPAAPAMAAAATPAAGVFSAQVGAFASSAQADRGWADAVRLAPGAAVGKGKTIEPAQVNGSTVYRALVTGFESRPAAVAFCATISAGGGNCLVR